MQARYYDPVIGRFYSNDPIGFRDIHSFNRYAYGNNNPYKYIDPNGMASEPAWTMFDSTFTGIKNYVSFSSGQQHSLKDMGATVVSEAEPTSFKTTPAKSVAFLAGLLAAPEAIVISLTASAVDLYQTGSLSGLAGSAGEQLSGRVLDSSNIKNPWVQAISGFFSSFVFSEGISEYEKPKEKGSDKNNSYLRTPYRQKDCGYGCSRNRPGERFIDSEQFSAPSK